MNCLRRKMPTLVSALAIILMAIIGCRKEDSEILSNDLRVTASNELYLNPLNIQLFDAKDEFSYPSNATIEVVGKDRNKILSILGDRTIPIKDGIIEIGVRRHDVPRANRPLEFGLVIKASGYLQTYRTYYLTSATETTQDVIRVFRLADLPKGVEAVSKTGKTRSKEDKSTLLSDITLATNGLSLEFKAGATFRDAFRKVLTGDVKISLVRFDATQETAAEGFPNGLGQNNAIDERGRNLGEGIFTPYGFYQLVVTVDNKPAKYISKPVEVTMDIPSSIKRGLNNNNTPVSIQAGDNIDLWSLDENERVWRKDGNARVISGGLNNLRVKFQQSHFSYGACADYNNNRVCTNGGFNANYTATPSATASTTPVFFVKVRSAHNPHITLGSFYANFSNNPFISLNRIVQGTNHRVTLDIYDNEGGTRLLRIENIVPCNRQTIDLRTLETLRRNSDYFTFVIDMNVVCKNRNPVQNFSPNATIYAAVVTPSGKLRYKYIGTMRDGKLTTCLLKRGVNYVFKVVRGPLAATTIQLNNPVIAFPTDRSILACTLYFTNTLWGLNNYPVTAEASNTEPNTFVFKLPDFEAPDYLCNKWLQFFPNN